MRRMAAGLCCLALGAPSPAAPEIFEAEEIAITLEAAPPQLRERAGVFVLKVDGFRRVRDSRNGFNCLIQRAAPDSFEPACFDAEGSATLLPVILYQAQLRARGLSSSDITAQVAAGFASGRFRAPRRTGVCHMLSRRNVVLDRRTGRSGAIGPQLLFYAPYVTNADLGATPNLGSHFIVVDEGAPTATIVVPVPDDLHRQ